MVVMGSFRGLLTFPTADGAAPVELKNPKWQTCTPHRARTLD
jgi:hypothetical protein